MDTTGDRIKKARLAANMTQTELAKKVGVKFSAIHKYETGIIVNLKRDTISALADALDVKPSYLMCMDDDPAPDPVSMTPLQKEAIKLIQSLSDEDLAKFVAMGKIMLGEK